MKAILVVVKSMFIQEISFAMCLFMSHNHLYGTYSESMRTLSLLQYVEHDITQTSTKSDKQWRLISTL